MSAWAYDPRDNFLVGSSQVGLPNDKPDFGILHDALDWQKLEVLNKEERNAQIVKRVNLFLYCDFPAVGRRAYDTSYYHAKEKARQGPDQKCPDSFIPFPLKKLKELFPITKDDNILIEMLPQACIQKFPDLGSVRLVFDKNMERFRAGKLCKQVETLARKLFEIKKINKIVAFGGYRLLTPLRPDGQLNTKIHSQHAVLLVIRDVWKKVHPNEGELPIYIQNLCYHKFDEEVANFYGMKVVNGSIGHQLGWTLLDESTFFVDLTTCFPLYQLAFEITRPAAIFVPTYIDIDVLPDETYYSITLEHNGEEVEIPTPGIYYGSETLECLEKEYQVEILNPEGMDGTSIGVDNGMPYGADGYMFTRDEFSTYLGFEPALYTRL